MGDTREHKSKSVIEHKAQLRKEVDLNYAESMARFKLPGINKYREIVYQRLDAEVMKRKPKLDRESDEYRLDAIEIAADSIISLEAEVDQLKQDKHVLCNEMGGEIGRLENRLESSVDQGLYDMLLAEKERSDAELADWMEIANSYEEALACCVANKEKASPIDWPTVAKNAASLVTNLTDKVESLWGHIHGLLQDRIEMRKEIEDWEQQVLATRDALQEAKNFAEARGAKLDQCGDEILALQMDRNEWRKRYNELKAEKKKPE